MTARPVAMVLNSLGSGGVPEAVLNLCCHLPRESYAPRVFALKPEATDTGQAARFAAAGVPVTVASTGDGKIGTVAELADWLVAEDIAILHCHSYRPNLYGRMAGALCRSSGLRIVAQYHNQYDDKWPAGSPALSLERHLAHVTDAMVAVSTDVRDHVARAVGVDSSRITVVPNGLTANKVRVVDQTSARLALGLGPQDLAIGLIGRVCAQKGHEDLVAAALMLRDRLPQAVFLMIGAIEDRDLHQRLVAQIAAAGAQQHIRFCGHMPDIAPAYAALDILAAPSRWEGFGLMLVEAMAAGVPIVATVAGAIWDVTGGAASLVPVADPAALAGAICDLDAKTRRALAQAGRLRARAFDWGKSAAQLAAVYDGLAAS